MTIGLITRNVAIVACAALVVGCGAKKEDEDNAKNLQDGTWTKKCEADGGGGSSLNFSASIVQGDGGDNGASDPEYKIETIKFDGANFNFEMTQWSDAACTATQKIGMKMGGTYKSGADAAAPATAVEGASNIDISVGTFQMAAYSDDMITYINSADSKCGVTATKGTFFDPSNCSFFKKDDGTSDGPTVGSVWYQIYKATETTLQWGDEDDTHRGRTAETRPTKLETGTYSK